MEDQLAQAALDYHRLPTPGKVTVQPTKAMTNQRDLSLAYSPGVAVPCLAIRDDPGAAYDYTAKGNLVAVVSNGTAVLGLGNIGAVAGKPVMEGKGCLFKKFAGIDVFDIEVDETDPDKLVEIVAALEPTFGGINLEDIKAPECFQIEQALRRRMRIPVFHDDQHGTAIVAAAALLNGLEVVGKRIGEVKLVCSGAGAAAIACLDLAVGLGVRKENIWITDSKGVVYEGRRQSMDEQKARYAQRTGARTLADIVEGADVFFGLSAAGVLKPEMVARMADRPIILAMANPDPEIRPEDARAVRPDVIIATGRSDYPNQVNNVLCFPFIFRGALDVGATTINEEMKLACVRALAELARAEQSDVVAAAYGTRELRFGPDYLIPRPFDPRLITKVAPAVAEAAMASGVATRPLKDLEAYRRSLQRYVYTSGTVMQPVFAAAAEGGTRRVVYAEGEDERVLQAAQVAVDENIARPILVGRPDAIAARIRHLGLRIAPGRDVDVASFDDEDLVKGAVGTYYQLGRRRGVERDAAAAEMRRNGTLIAAMLLREGRADAMLCGTFGRYRDHLRYIADVVFLDLEDAVAPDQKEQARRNIVQGINEIDWGTKTLSVRINGLDTPYMYRDVVDVLEQAGDRLDLIMIPKVGTAADVYAVDMLVTQVEQAKERRKRIGFELIIETALGMANIDEIAHASKRNESLHFGVADYAASTRARTVGIGGPNPDYAVLTDKGEDERVLQAAQVAVDENLACPVLVGRPDTIAVRIRDLGLRITPGRDAA